MTDDALDAHRAAMQLGETFHQRETKTGARMVARIVGKLDERIAEAVDLRRRKEV